MTSSVDPVRPGLRVVLGCAAYPPLGRGGGPISSALLAQGLSAQGADVRVLVVGNENAVRLDGMVEIKTIKSLNIYSDWLAEHASWKKAIWHIVENFNPRAFLRVRKELRKVRPDIYMTVSAENINVASWLAARSLGIPCVHVLQSYFLMCWRGSMFREGVNCGRCRSCKTFSVGKKALSRFVDAVVAETDFLIQTHLKAGYFSNATVSVIPGAVEKAGRRIKPRRGSLRVGYLGTHTRNKGIETLADAAARLSNRRDITFHIGGSGDPTYTEELKARFPEESTTFLGWIGTEEFFSRIDVIVVPSVWREPFGRVSVEGSAFGVPAIVTRSGGLPENVSDGEDGFVFEPGDDETLAARLAQMADNQDLYRRLSDAVRRRAARYDSGLLSRRMLALLTEVAASRLGRARKFEGFP